MKMKVKNSKPPKNRIWQSDNYVIPDDVLSDSPIHLSHTKHSHSSSQEIMLDLNRELVSKSEGKREQAVAI